MAQFPKVAISAQSNLLKDIMNTLLVNDMNSDFKVIREIHAEVIELTRRCKVRGEQIKQLESVVGSSLATECLQLLRDIQDEKLEKNRTLLKLISETLIKVLKTISFVAKMRKNY
ncbi:hypothetical protein CTI12_AA562070 [Artemisia annua]|uniref:Uncharacterized protein n=1 Tax=Artemisia annua TaxID=35608 RepID=A0A2U1KUR9_ARTAN|nr:hypothetical protein CTI12_AA562070 [Artemisia annua]